MRNFFLKFFAIIFLAKSACAGLPFVTDDAAIVRKNQLLIETYTETWHLPAAHGASAGDSLGQYAGFSYGIRNNLELAFGAMAAYDFTGTKPSFANPFLQLKSIIYQAKKPAIPTVAISGGVVGKSGKGLYYDSATNAYLLGIATSRFFDEDLIIHFNCGSKNSFDVSGHGNIERTHLGLALDLAVIGKDIRVFAESYNGAPNSPRDSPGYFHSYQFGLKWVRWGDVSFNILYGSQPTFIGYGAGQESFYRRSNWVQFGMRKAFEDIF